MSDQGVFQVHRGIFDHPIFAPEPFTEREAWIWMVSAAAWAAKRVRVGKALVDLERGQLAFALRFLAVKFQWTDSKVRRFLKKLQADAMIAVSTTREATQVTICNYDQYQFGRRTDDAQTDAQTDALATHKRRKEEELKHLRKEDLIVEERAVGFTDGSKKLASAYWKALGFNSPLEIPPQYAGTDWRAVEWERAGWTEDIISSAVKRIGPGKPTNYYEKAFASDFAKRQAPLPKVEVREAETITVTHGRNDPAKNLSAVARRLAADGVAFGERPAAPSLRSIEGGTNVRLLPQGGGERPGDLCGGDVVGVGGISKGGN